MGPYNFPSEVIAQLQHYQRLYQINDAAYFLVGGSDSCKHVLRMTENELQKNRIDYSKVDMLGVYYRQVVLAPSEGKIKIYRGKLR